jgi:hypothetical protein
MKLTLVVPLRCSPGHGDHRDLREHLASLLDVAQVIVVDNSDGPEFEDHARAFTGGIDHLPPDPSLRMLNGKVPNVTTGVRAAEHEAVVIADDDVRHTAVTLRAVVARLRGADLVVPTNVFDPMPWHARWDTARTLVNRSLWVDYPGTLGVRRSTFLAMGAYDGDVLFENLELIRTVRAAGGRLVHAPDVYVRRLPPAVRTFLGQRVRQAYDDLAQPPKLAAMLALAPLAVAIAARRARRLVPAAVAAVALAEVGRRRHGGAEAFPMTASLFAPAWVAERSVCVWVAAARRLLLGGVRYRGARIRYAATPMRRLRRRMVAQAAEGREPPRERAA